VKERVVASGKRVLATPPSNFFMKKPMLAWLLLLFITSTIALAQTRSYPKEIRGYKIERTAIEIRKPDSKNRDSNSNGRTEERGDSDSDVDALIRFGKPQLARVTPLGITFKVPIVVAPVTQKGRVDFLMFEDMSVNDTSVQIDEYHRAFDLPNKNPSTLRDPLSFYIYLPSAVLAAIGDWTNAKEVWPVTGRVYVFGKFKKGLFSFKRCVPVELNLTMRNPLKED
jgi:hypothetical protein